MIEKVNASEEDLARLAFSVMETAMGMSDRYMSLAKLGVTTIAKDCSSIAQTGGYLFSIDLSSQSVPPEIREAFEHLLRLIETHQQHGNPNPDE